MKGRCRSLVSSLAVEPGHFKRRAVGSEDRTNHSKRRTRSRNGLSVCTRGISCVGAISSVRSTNSDRVGGAKYCSQRAYRSKEILSPSYKPFEIFFSYRRNSPYQSKRSRVSDKKSSIRSGSQQDMSRTNSKGSFLRKQPLLNQSAFGTMRLGEQKAIG